MKNASLIVKIKYKTQSWPFIDNERQGEKKTQGEDPILFFFKKKSKINQKFRKAKNWPAVKQSPLLKNVFNVIISSYVYESLIVGMIFVDPYFYKYKTSDPVKYIEIISENFCTKKLNLLKRIQT